VTTKDLKYFEARLLEDRERLVKELTHLSESIKNSQRDSTGDLSAYSFHMADLGTDAMEREKQFLFASAEGRELHSIDEALRRIYRKEYGYCESCKGPIARARLEVVPQATLCITCKEREEKSGRRFD
jgi:RNA polymerase-binding protein DksA